MDDLIKRDDALKACMLREDNPPTEMQLSLRNVISALLADPAAIREAALREAAWCFDDDVGHPSKARATILALIKGETK